LASGRGSFIDHGQNDKKGVVTRDISLGGGPQMAGMGNTKERIKINSTQAFNASFSGKPFLVVQGEKRTMVQLPG